MSDRDKKKVLFITGTNYQLLFTYIINKLAKGKFNLSYLLSASYNSGVNSMANKLQDFNDTCIIDKNKIKNVKTPIDYLKNRKILNEVNNFIKNIDPSLIIVFKDNDIINIPVIDFAHKKNIDVVLVEEGLGIYEKNKGNKKKNKFKNISKRALNYPDTASKVQGQNFKVGKIAVREPSLLPEEKKIGKEIIEIPNIAPPSKLLEEFIKDAGLEEYEKKTTTNIALYIGQPLSEENKIDIKKEKEIINNVSNNIIKNGWQLVIKPHPREIVEKYQQLSSKEDVLLFKDAFYPAELLSLQLSPRLIVTPFSSAAVNISFWFQIPCILMYMLFFDDNFYIDKKLLKGNIVSSFEDFNNILKGVKTDINDDFNFNSKELYLGFVDKLFH